MAVEGWATAMMELRLRVNKDQAQRDINDLDATPGGKKAGSTFGTGFSAAWEPKKRETLGKFTADSGKAGDQAGRSAGTSFGRSFTKLAGGIISSFIGGAVQTELAKLSLPADVRRGGGPSVAGGLAAGIGPNILGLGLKASGIIGLGGAALGAVPALAGGLGAAGIAGVGAGALAGGFAAVQSQAAPAMQARKQAQAAVASATTPAQAAAAQTKLAAANAEIAKLSPALQSIIKSEDKIQATWQKFAKSLAPLFAGPLAQVARLFTQLTGPLHDMFSGAATLAKPLIDGLGGLAKQVLPLLGQAFRAVAPLMAPLLAGLTGLLTGLLPGLIALLKVAGPAVSVLAGFLSQLGSGLGGMFATFAPVISASAKILGALLGIVTGLLPIIAQLAAVFATAVAPAFVSFAGVIQSLLPFLVIIGKIVAELASAILTDLVAAFGAVVSLFRAVAPALTAFASAISGVFVVLENSGVFAMLGSALESVAKPLGVLISAILRGLTPILPPIIKFVSQLAGILVAGLAAAIVALLPPLTQLATKVLAALASVLPVILPLLLTLAGVFTAALVGAISGVAAALSAIITAIPLGVLQAIIYGVLGVFAAFKIWAGLQLIIGGVTAAVEFLSGSMVRLGVQVLIAAAKAVLGWVAASAVIVGSFIAQAAAATAAFIAENLATLGIIAGITLLVGAIIYLATHWSQVWGAVKRIAADVWQFLTHGWGQILIPQLYLIRKVIELVRDHWRAAWATMKQIAHDFYQWIWTDFGAKLGSFFTKTIPGWLSSALGAARLWWRNIASAFTNGWNTVWRNTITPMANLFTKDLPGWFRDAVRGAGLFWANITATIRAPVVKVVDTVLNGLINVFDWITSHIGLGSPIKPVHPFGLAAGGKVGKVLAGTGPTADDVLVRVSKDETVVSADDSNLLAPVFAMLGIPGYAKGGKVGQNPPIGPHGQPGVHPGGLGGLLHKVFDAGKIAAAFATGNSKAMTNAFADLLGVKSGASAVLGQVLTQIPKELVKDLVGWIMGQGGGASGSAIADYAASFIGKIPYVWGGTNVPGGADCSGFVQAIYHHFGISAPRTSEAQGAWVKRGPPVAGGLALYHSPAGGADPGHVAIVRNALQVISQGGGMGPDLMNIHAMPLLWTGTPPGGLGAGDKGGLYLGPGGSFQTDIQTVLRSLGLPLTLTPNWLRQIQSESGGRLDAVNRTDINAQQGHPSVGILQLIPSTFAQYAGPYRNAQPLVNMGGGPVSLNAMAQIYAAIHYANDVYHGAAMGSVIGRSVGYANGGWINEPVTGVGRYSRTLYQFGERGRELVVPEADTRGGDGSAVVSELRALRQSLEQVPARTAAGVARAVTAPTSAQATAARVGARY